MKICLAQTRPLKGNIEGNIKTKSKIVLGKSSEVIGNIKAQNAEIEGTVTGKIDVSEILILKKTSVIKGNISTGRLIVEPGSQFNGGCKMGKMTPLEKDSTKPDSNVEDEKETLKEPQKAGTV